MGHLVAPEGHLVSLVQVRIHTGRRHQIRVHFAEAGYPLIWDKDYGGPRPHWSHRLCLHAQVMSLQTLEGPLVARVPVPDDLKTTFERLGLVDRLSRACRHAALEE